MSKTLFTNTHEEQKIERMMQEIPKQPPLGEMYSERELYCKDKLRQIEKRHESG